MITKWVIPTKLSVEDVWHTPNPALVIMAETSNDMIVLYVNNFIRANENSQDIITRKVAEKLKECYGEVNRLKDFLSSNEALEMAKNLSTFNISDIRATAPMETLKQYRCLVDMLFQNRDTVVGETRALTSDYLEQQVQRLFTLLSSYKESPESCTAIHKMISFMEKDKQLFKNAPFKRSNPTVLRYAVNNRDRYELLLYGLNFLIDKKEQGVDARSWRVL